MFNFRNFSPAVRFVKHLIKYDGPKRMYAFDHYRSTVAFRIQTERKNVPKSAYVLLAIPCVCFGLGVWQIFRLRWKLNLLDSMKALMAEQPIPLPNDIRELKALEFRPIKVKGHFIHDEEFLIKPRVRVDLKSNSSKAIFTSDSTTAGAMVVTPFKLSDRDLVILVNRGFVPKEKQSKKTRPEGQIEGEIELVGITRNHENRPTFVKQSDPAKGFYAFRDVEGMAYQHDTAPVYLEATKSSTVPGGPIGGQTLVNLRNEHAAYSVTWFGLSVATTWLWFKRFYKFV
uniref:SURF1-like protein n=1 Tax=Romanomermis culicivorax TaxID=13658 RepID=A0A915HY21_ROMCU